MHDLNLAAIGRRIWPLVVPCLLVTVVSLVVAQGSDVLERTVINALILLVVVVGLYIFTGLTGVFSFGQPAFMAIGAYTAGILTVTPVTKPFLLPHLPHFLASAHLDPVSATIVGGVVAAVFAALLAVPLMRLSGISASLVTLGVLFVVNVVARQWIAITNGTAGLSGVPTTLHVSDALLWGLAAMVAAYVFQRSRIGLQLRASREDDVAAASVGIGVAWRRGIAFVLSAFFCGIAGGMYAAFIGGLTPDAFFLPITFLTLAMLVIGGRTSLAGAAVGTLVIASMQEVLRRVEQSVGRPGLSQVVLGLLMILILVRRPAGITGGREITWPFGGPRRNAGTDAGASPAVGARSVPEDPELDHVGARP
jgi:branched-chain amino acid transport system permease protein